MPRRNYKARRRNKANSISSGARPITEESTHARRAYVPPPPPRSTVIHKQQETT